MRRMLEDLAFNDYAGGLGPLALAAIAGFNAARADTAFDRWMWVAAAAVMAGICVFYVGWAVRRKRRLSRARR